VLGRGILLTWTPAAVKQLAARGFDPTFGARPLKRLIQKQVSDALAAQLLAGEIRDGDMAEIDASKNGETLTVRKKPVAVTV
jgi:ATP-dependent Clp protease ATP-binding subunit ClpB